MSALPHEPLAVPPPGSGQLAYASAKGGFGVQGTVGAVTADESTAIVSGINRDRREFGQDLPPFVSPADAARLHRNFTVQPTPVGLVTWLSGPAGMDGSGRPGNVFTHALLERFPRPPGAPRPIERWRSPAWLTPFGAADVESARLPEPFGDDHPAVHREAAIAFIRDPDAWRVGTLCALLDALTSSGDAPVLVGVSSPDEAAQWMGAISHLLGRPYAERLSFSLWEAANTMSTRRVRSKLVFVPEHQLDPTWTTPVTRSIVRTSEEPAAREWEPSPSPTQALSPFGPLAAALFSFFDDPAAVLADMDNIADRLGESAGQPGWPLAMALARHVEAWPELAAPVADALLRECPDTLDSHPDLWALAVRVVNRHIGGSAEAAWAAIQAYGPIPVPMRDALRKVHLGLRLEHPGDLARAVGAAPVVSAGRWSAWDDPEIHTLVEQGLRAARAADPMSGAVLTLRMADAVCGESLPGSSSTTMTQPLREAVADLVTPMLLQADPTTLLRACGPLRNAALHAIVRPALSQLPLRGNAAQASPGRRLTPAVIAWLYPSPPVVTTALAVTELDVDAAAAYAPLGLTSPWWRWVRSVILRYAVSAAPSVPVDGLLHATVPRDNLTVGEARGVLAAGSGRLPVDHLLGAIALMGTDDVGEAFLLVRDAWGARGLAMPDPAAQRLIGELGAVLGNLVVRPGSSRGQLLQQAHAAVSVAAQLNNRARTGLGTFWVTAMSSWVALAPRQSVHQFGRDLAAVQWGDDAQAALALEAAFAAVIESERWAVLAAFAALAIQLDEGWPYAPGLTAEVLSRLHRPDSAPGVEIAARRIYAGLDRKELQMCRDEVVTELEAGERLDRDARRAANDWFERVGGATGIGSLFRRGKSEVEP